MNLPHNSCTIIVKAILILGFVIQANGQEGSLAKSAQEYQKAGVEHFMRGEFKEALDAWDSLIKLVPEQAPYHWQRGIAYYYAGEFEKGRKQFELHQSVNPRDVENAVWHYLCVARAEGPKIARERLIPIEGDSRVPMKEVHALFAGRGSEADVLSAAKAGNPSEAALRDRLCYAHLYLGLFWEAEGEKEKALEHIRKAATEFSQTHYMGKVAQVHWKVLQEGKKKTGLH